MPCRLVGYPPIRKEWKKPRTCRGFRLDWGNAPILSQSTNQAKRGIAWAPRPAVATGRDLPQRRLAGRVMAN